VGNDDKALGKRIWKNLARNRQIWQNHLRKATACFASDDDDHVIGPYLLTTFKFSSLDCLYALYHMLARSELQYTSAVWNSIKSNDDNQLECIKQNFVSICFYRFSFMYLIAILLFQRI
jgi:hypothetical protein